MSGITREKIATLLVVVGVAVVAMGVGAGALSTPYYLTTTELPGGIVRVYLGLWVLLAGVFTLTAVDRARFMVPLSTMAIPAFIGASQMAMQNESMFWIALGFTVFTATALVSMLIRSAGSTLRIPLVVVVLSLAVAAFSFTRKVPSQPRGSVIPAHMIPAERPE
jgi:hypothetical protein